LIALASLQKYNESKEYGLPILKRALEYQRQHINTVRLAGGGASLKNDIKTQSAVLSSLCHEVATLTAKCHPSGYVVVINLISSARPFLPLTTNNPATPLFTITINNSDNSDKEKDELEALFEEAVALDPDNNSAALALSLHLRRRGDISRCKGYCEKILAACLDSDEFLAVEGKT